VKQRLLNVLVGVSLVLCVAAAVLWVRSYDIGELFEYVKLGSVDRTFSVYLLSGATGNIHFFRTQWSFKKPGLAEKFALSDSELFHEGFHFYSSGPLSKTTFSLPYAWHFLGFGFQGWRPQLDPADLSIEAGSQFVSELDLQIPDWFIVLLTASLPAIAVWFRLKRRSRSRKCLCLVCGYDLRATPNRCPECGTAVPTKEPISN
jgi:hypothetical protein